MADQIIAATDLGIDQAAVYETCVEAISSSVATAYLAVQAVLQSCRNPYVVDSVRKTAKTVVITAACQYALLTMMTWPLRLLAWIVYVLSLTIIKIDVGALVEGSMSVYPLLTLLLTRTVFRHQMEACFFHTLDEQDLRYSQRLSAQPRQYKATITQKVLQRFGITGEQSEDIRLVLLLMLLGMLLRSWRQLPYVGLVVAPILQYLSIRYMVGQHLAAVVFSLMAALIPRCEQPVMMFVELWASSKVLASVSMKSFLDRCVPRSKRSAFVRTFEYTIVSYFLLPTALLRVPLLGSLVAFPAAALGACCLTHILSQRPSLQHTCDIF